MKIKYMGKLDPETKKGLFDLMSQRIEKNRIYKQVLLLLLLYVLCLYQNI